MVAKANLSIVWFQAGKETKKQEESSFEVDKQSDETAKYLCDEQEETNWKSSAPVIIFNQIN